MDPIARTAVLALALTALFSLGACQGTRTLQDPVLEIQSASGKELGIATDYGVIFLGRTVQAGEVEVTAWYGDGPSIELAVVEPLGSGLFTAEPEIRVPSVPVSFHIPKTGESLVVSGRRGSKRWQESTKIVADPRVQGLLIPLSGAFDDDLDQTGAGVFRVIQEQPQRLELVGLVSGILTVTDESGRAARFMTVVGADQFWRLVTYKRAMPEKPRWIYREDIL